MSSSGNQAAAKIVQMCKSTKDLGNTLALCQNHPNKAAPVGLDFRLAIWEPPMTLAGTNAAGQSPALQVTGLVA